MREKSVEKQQARNLRAQGESVGDIAQALGVSKSSVSCWVRDVSVDPERRRQVAKDRSITVNRSLASFSHSRRSSALSSRLAMQEVGRSEARANPLSLHLVGCMLYWAEGSKDRNRVSICNTDPSLLIIFIRFLRECFGVTNDRIRASVYFYDDIHTPEETLGFWSSALGLGEECFGKCIPKQARKPRHKRREYGICTISVHSTELVQRIYGAIQEYSGHDNDEWVQ